MKVGILHSVVNMTAIASLLLTSGCAWVTAPDARNVNIPSPIMADERKTAINERPDSVMYLPLGEDILVPEVAGGDDFPKEFVGPFELRGETLAGALQLILADYDISLAFESQAGLTRRVTVANLRGDLGKVVNQVCALANLYCAYEDGVVTVKDKQTFTVTLPPIGTKDETNFLNNVAQGLGAILGTGAEAPTIDPTTRTLVYSATQRTADVAARYFQRLRANTAMIVFETYIWEVALDSGNSTGIQWDKIATFGKFDASIDINGSSSADFLNPVSIGLPTAHEITGTPTNLVQLLSQFGAVKTISQPQITVLSGSKAELRVADTRNYVSEIATTLDEGQSTTSVNTDSVDTGFTLTIASSWDKSTVYANVDIELTNVQDIEDFSFSDGGANGATTTIQLPQTSERQLSTQIRVRPGDSVLIAGLVRENDRFDSRGIGLMQPILPDSRTAQAANLELVILLRPRVVIYTAANDKRYLDYAMKKHKLPGTGVAVTSPKELGESPDDGTGPQPLGAGTVPHEHAIVPASRPRVSPATSPVSSAPTSITPVSSVAPAQPVYPAANSAPVASASPVYPAASPAATASPVYPAANSAPASAKPAAAAPVVTTTQDDQRFRLGSGYVSKDTVLPPAEKSTDGMKVTPASAQPSAAPAAPAVKPQAANTKAPSPVKEAISAPPQPGNESLVPSVPMFEEAGAQNSPTDQISIFPSP